MADVAVERLAEVITASVMIAILRLIRTGFW